MVPQIHIVRTADGVDFPLPSYTSKHHFALNLMAAVGNPIKINPGERVHVPIGFAIALPDGLCGQIVSNTELALHHGVVVLDAPHLIHPASRAPIFVLLQNESTKQFVLKRGTLIAQMLIVQAYQVAWKEIEDKSISNVQTTSQDIFVDEQDAELSSSPAALISTPKRPKVSIRQRSTHED